jgi:hypothetical protein
MPVYAKPLTLNKGVDNRIQFQFLNQEQKPVDITGKSITCRIPKSYHIPFALNGLDLVEHCGPTPSLTCGGLSPVPMRTFLSLLGIDAIIGPSWMQRVKIWLNPIEHTIALSA